MARNWRIYTEMVEILRADIGGGDVGGGHFGGGTLAAVIDRRYIRGGDGTVFAVADGANQDSFCS